jgi:hypothetical protein
VCTPRSFQIKVTSEDAAMGNLIAGAGAHREQLRELMGTTRGPVRIASAYVTDTDLVPGSDNRDIRLLTGLSTIDIVTGATSLDSLGQLVETGVQCRRSSETPRVHAKVYIFGGEVAVVSSANLTTGGLDANIEVGVSPEELQWRNSRTGSTSSGTRLRRWTHPISPN